MKDDKRMASMIVALDLGKSLAQARASGIVSGSEEIETWKRLAREVAEIKAAGGSVKTPTSSWD